MKDADEKNKDEKKQDRIKPRQNEKNKEPDLQGDGRKKGLLDGPPSFAQQHTYPEVDNWKKYGKRHIFQRKFITDHHLETPSQFAGNFTLVATTNGWIITTTNNVANWSSSRAKPRSNMINSRKGGHPIHLRSIVRQPPQGCHRVHAWYKMKHR